MSTSQYVKWRASGYGPVQKVSLGVLGTGVSANHYTADGKNVVTELVCDAKLPDIVGGTNLGLGFLIWTFPAGVHMLKYARISLALQQADGFVTADTPKLGLGDLIASGAVTDLTGTAGFDNILTEQAMNDCDGTVEEKTLVIPTAGHLLNEAAGRKGVYVNVADGWAASGEDELGIVGSVWLEWTHFSGS